MTPSPHTPPLNLLACPKCKSALEAQPNRLVCTGTDCGAAFSYCSGIPALLLPPPQVVGHDVDMTPGLPVDAAPEVNCEYPNARQRGVSPTAPFCHYAITNRLIRDYVTSALKSLPGTGMNIGAGTIPYREGVPDTAEMWGVDIQKQPGSDVHLLSDIQNSGIATNCLDWILCTSVLEHIPLPHRAMQEMARSLKPDGCLILTVPQTFPIHGAPADYWRFTCHGIRVLADKAGLSPIDITPMGTSRAVRWQQQAIWFHRKYGGCVDHSLSWPKRIVLNSLAVVARVHSAICCLLAREHGTDTGDPCNVLCWGALLKKRN